MSHTITLSNRSHSVTVSDNAYTIQYTPTVHTITLQSGAGLQGPGYSFTFDTVDPSTAPSASSRFWYNTVTGRFWFSTGTSTVSDWHELLVGGSP